MKTLNAVPNSRSRRRGVVAVYVGLTLVLMLGAAALSIDAGFMYTRRAQAQKAADAAALAGAYQLSFFQGITTANTNTAFALAKSYAAKNSYIDDNGVTTTVTPTYPVGNNTSWFKVDVQRREPLFFARALGFDKANIGATAIAQFITPSVDIEIPSNIYGADITNGASELPWNYSIYGPEALHSYGDNISTRYLDNGQPNPEYQQVDDNAADAVGGYNFILKNNNMSNPKMEVELYDPDCYNRNDTHDDQKNFGDEFNVDELHGAAVLPSGNARNTITNYSLFSDNGTPDDFTDDRLIARYTSDNTDTNDLKWMTPAGFSFNKADYAVTGKTVNYRINVATTKGSSENGFSLRAGPPHTTSGGAPSTTAFNKNNGTSMAIRGIIPINFNYDNVADFPLGVVPSSARGGTLTITKFDTDIPASQADPPPANTVYYTCSAYGSRRFSGTVDMTDNAFSIDQIQLDADYPGGTWTAHYTAGWGDTSTWKIAASGVSPGSIALVR